VIFDDHGRRLASQTAAAFDSLSRLPLQVASDSSSIFHELAPLSFDSDARSKYSFTYLRDAQIDGLPAYQFGVVPAFADQRNPQFQGIIWIGGTSLSLLRAAGVTLPGTAGMSYRVPMHFVEFRSQLDGKHWFPVLEVGEVSSQGMTFRETVKFSNYKRFGSTAKLLVAP